MRHTSWHLEYARALSKLSLLSGTSRRIVPFLRGGVNVCEVCVQTAARYRITRIDIVSRAYRRCRSSVGISFHQAFPCQSAQGPHNKVQKSGCAPYQLAPRVCQSSFKAFFACRQGGPARRLLLWRREREVCVCIQKMSQQHWH